jgi:hypothetical protein
MNSEPDGFERLAGKEAEGSAGGIRTGKWVEARAEPSTACFDGDFICCNRAGVAVANLVRVLKRNRSTLSRRGLAEGSERSEVVFTVHKIFI